MAIYNMTANMGRTAGIGTLVDGELNFGSSSGPLANQDGIFVEYRNYTGSGGGILIPLTSGQHVYISSTNGSDNHSINYWVFNPSLLRNGFGTSIGQVNYSLPAPSLFNNLGGRTFYTKFNLIDGFASISSIWSVMDVNNCVFFVNYRNVSDVLTTGGLGCNINGNNLEIYSSNGTDNNQVSLLVIRTNDVSDGVDPFLTMSLKDSGIPLNYFSGSFTAGGDPIHIETGYSSLSDACIFYHMVANGLAGTPGSVLYVSNISGGEFDIYSSSTLDESTISGFVLGGTP